MRVNRVILWRTDWTSTWTSTSSAHTCPFAFSVCFLYQNQTKLWFFLRTSSLLLRSAALHTLHPWLPSSSSSSCSVSHPPTGHSGRGDCYVNAPVNGSDWEWLGVNGCGLKQIMFNCLSIWRHSAVKGWQGLAGDCQSVHTGSSGGGGGGGSSSHDGTQVGIPEAETSNAEVKTFVKCATVVSASAAGCVSPSLSAFVSSVWGGLLFCSLFHLFNVSLNKVGRHFKL